MSKWNLQNHPFQKGKYIFQTSMFGFHVRFWRGLRSQPGSHDSPICPIRWPVRFHWNHVQLLMPNGLARRPGFDKRDLQCVVHWFLSGWTCCLLLVLPSLKLAFLLVKIAKRRVISQPLLFMGQVSSRGCIWNVCEITLSIKQDVNGIRISAFSFVVLLILLPGGLGTWSNSGLPTYQLSSSVAFYIIENP